jgi:acyl-[acyl-carrier-protein]-phospholipid O-acyltransferase/long-chain-fatty-acid--[acyl-carrier-protein] ligase
MHLLTTRRFLPLFLTQLLGAFNDNLFKNAIIMLITYRLVAENAAYGQMLVTLAGALFILPYFLFSATAGQLADKYDRARIARITKLAEIVVMAVAVLGFIWNDAYFLLFVLFCLGIQATFFGPVKYALLPQHLKEDELVAGNAYVEAGMFLAILLGTIAGGLLIIHPNGVYYICLSIMACALAGYMTARKIPPAPAPDAQLTIDWNMLRQTWRVVQHDRKNKALFRSILCISWFWLVGAVYLSQFPAYAKHVLAADETVVTLFLSCFSVGIAIGSLASSWLQRGRISTRYLPLGAMGMCIAGLDLFFASVMPHDGQQLIGAAALLSTIEGLRITLDLVLFSVFAGIYIVPLYAIMQHESDVRYRARTVATTNIFNSLFIVVSALVVVWLLSLQVSIPQLFLGLSVLNGLLALYIRRLVSLPH